MSHSPLHRHAAVQGSGWSQACSPSICPGRRGFAACPPPGMAATVSQEAEGRLGLEAIVPLLPCPVLMGPGRSAAASRHGAAPGWMRQRKRRGGPLNSGQQHWDNGGRRGHERGPRSKGECLKRSLSTTLGVRTLNPHRTPGPAPGAGLLWHVSGPRADVPPSPSPAAASPELGLVAGATAAGSNAPGNHIMSRNGVTTQW